MRYVFTTLVLFALASSASATPLVLDYGSQDRLFNSAIATTQTIELRLAEYGLVRETWAVPVTTTDVGRVWNLDDTTAPGFNVAWATVQSALHQLEGRGWVNSGWKLGFFTPDLPIYDKRGHPPRSGYFLPPLAIGFGLRPVIDQLDRIELTLEEFYSVPIGAILKFRFRVYGDGQLVPVPEPASCIMLLLGAIHFSGTSRERLRRR